MPPIAIAAGTAMYLLDQVSRGATLTFTDYATAAVLTFAASAILGIFVLLGYGVLYLPLIGQPPRARNISAGALDYSCGTSGNYVYVAFELPKGADKVASDTLLYVFCLAGVAVLGSLIAHFLSGPPPPLGSLPAG